MNLEEVMSFHKRLKPLGRNRVYAMHLVKIDEKTNKRKIVDCLFLKKNDFDYFKNKVSEFETKSNRLPFKNVVAMDVNIKNVKQGLQKAMKILKQKIWDNKDVTNYTLIINKCIRSSNVTSYNVILTTDKETIDCFNYEYVIFDGLTYYIVTEDFSYEHKVIQSVPVPGIRGVEIFA